MGTLTLAQMRTELYYLVNSADEFDPNQVSGQARCDRFLQWSYDRVQAPNTFNHREKQGSQDISLVASTGSYAITLHAISHVRYNATNRRLSPADRRQFSELTFPSGPPTRYAEWGGLLYLDYIPTSTEAGNTVTVWGWTEPAALTVSPASILNRIWDEVIVTGAAWRAWRSLGDMVRADTYREEYAAMVNDAKDTLTLGAHDIGWATTVGVQTDYM